MWLTAGEVPAANHSSKGPDAGLRRKNLMEQTGAEGEQHGGMPECSNRGTKPAGQPSEDLRMMGKRGNGKRGQRGASKILT